MGPVAFDNDGRRVYMVDNTGRERNVIRTYDLITRELGEPVYGGGDIEAIDVLQASNPEGFGQTLWRAGDNEWGRKMQDDKDDGARWLAEQGIAVRGVCRRIDPASTQNGDLLALDHLEIDFHSEPGLVEGVYLPVAVHFDVAHESVLLRPGR